MLQVYPSGKFILRKGEYCKVRTSLVSTRFTQHNGLLALLNWTAAEDHGSLLDIVKRFMFVDVAEVMKACILSPSYCFQILILNGNEVCPGNLQCSIRYVDHTKRLGENACCVSAILHL